MPEKAPKSHLIYSKDRLLWELGGLLLKSTLTRRLGVLLVDKTEKKITSSSTRDWLNSWPNYQARPQNSGEHAPY